MHTQKTKHQKLVVASKPVSIPRVKPDSQDPAYTSIARQLLSHVVGEVVLLLDVRLEAVRHVVEVVFADAADEAVGLHVLLHRLQLVTQLAERVNDQT